MCDKVQRLIDESNAEKDRIIVEQQKALETQKAEQQKALEAQKAKYDKINIAHVTEINRLKAQIAALQGNR